jgi:hypothetical protein
MGNLFQGRRLASVAAAAVAVGVLVGPLAVTSGASLRSSAAFPPYPTSLSAADIALAAKYVGGKAGIAANSSSITIGLLNDSTSPEASEGAVVAEDLINGELDGIKGHQLKLDECDVSDSATGTACANQLIADHVSAVLTGAVDVQPDTSMYQTLFAAHIPVIIGNSLTPTDFMPPAGPAVSYMPGSPGVVLGIAKFIGSGGLGSTPPSVAAFYLQGDPASQAAFDLLKTSPSLDGISVTGIQIAQPWSLSNVEAAMAGASAKSKVFIPLVPSQVCTEFASAEKVLGVKPVTVATGQCFTSTLTSTASMSGWYFADYGVNPYMFDKALAASEQLGVYIASAAYYGSTVDSSALFGGASFANVLTLAKLYGEAGPTATGPQLSKLLEAFTGPQWGISGPIACGTTDALAFPSSCATFVGVARLLNGQWQSVQDAYNGKLIDPFPAPSCLGSGSCDTTSLSTRVVCLTPVGCPAGGTTVSTVSVGALMNGKLAPNQAVTVHFLSSSTPTSSGSWCQGANGHTKTGHTNAQGIFQFNYTSAGAGGAPPIASFCIIKATIGKASVFAAIDQSNDPAAWKVEASPRKQARFALASSKASLRMTVLNSRRAPVSNDPTTFYYSEVPSTVGACGAVEPEVRKTKSPHGRATLKYTPSSVWGTSRHPVYCTLIGEEADTAKTSNKVVIYQTKP